MDFTFLTEDQAFYNKLEILEKYWTKYTITYFAILLGDFVSKNYYTSEG